jgi:hypothetical protein
MEWTDLGLTRRVFPCSFWSDLYLEGIDLSGRQSMKRYVKWDNVWIGFARLFLDPDQPEYAYTYIHEYMYVHYIYVCM